MTRFQKIGGIAALIEAGTFVVGFVLYLTLLSSANYRSPEIDPLQHVAFLADNQGLMYAWNLIIFVLFGVALVVLALALHQRLVTVSPPLVQTATAFGLIWAGLVIASGMIANVGAASVVDIYSRDPDQAASAWLAMELVVAGLGGGIEIVGGLWILLVSWVALRSGGLPRALAVMGMVVGAAGVATTIPVLAGLGAVFGLGSIIWFVWLGVALLLDGTAQRESEPLSSSPL